MGVTDCHVACAPRNDKVGSVLVIARKGAALTRRSVSQNYKRTRRFRGAFIRQLTERIGADALRFFMLI